MTHNSKKKGFTLLELLIVIAIIAILSVIIIFVLNPAETLRKARDTQRMSDLNTLKTALGLYLTSTTTIDLDGSVGANFTCLNGSAADAEIAYSVDLANQACSGNPVEGGDTGATFISDYCYSLTAASGSGNVDGTGWVPVNMAGLIGGSPISNLPLDPTNSLASSTQPTSTDYVYRYACQSTGAAGKPSRVFELGAVLESEAFTLEDNRMAKDGGDSTSYYEVGTSLKLMTSGY